MNGRWKRYPEYRDSEVEWLGEVPSHWDVRRLRFRADFNPPRSEANDLPADSEVSFVPMEAVGELGGLDLSEVRTLEDIGSGYTWFQDGDVVVAKITPCFENGKGAIAEGLTNGAAFGTTELHVVRPRKGLDARFLFYLTLSHSFRGIGASTMYGAGGQKRVPDTFIRDFRPAIPSDEREQRAIAAFLDRETERIDALTAKKEELIRLLEEKRTALISHVVTKGLDPSVPMKESGVEWLGKIPAHWEVRRLRHVKKGSFQYGASESGVEGQDDWVRFVRITDLTSEGCLRDDTIARLPPDLAAPYILTEDDLLFARSGATVGKAVRYDASWGLACFAGYLIRMTCDPAVADSHFVECWTQSRAYSEEVRRSFVQATIQNISAQRYADFLLAVPPVDEQRQIAAKVQQQRQSTQAVIDAIAGQLGFLHEHRQALITAAVTGQIDVRDEVAS